MNFKTWALLFFIAPGIAIADPFSGVQMLRYQWEQLQQLKSQYDLLNDAYQNSKSQLRNIEDLKNFNSGNYGYGAFENGLDALNGWQNPADNWKDALENIAGGNQARYAELVKSYEASHPMLSDADFAKGSTPENTERFQYQKKVTKAISIETTKTFNEINARLKNIHTLALKIDQTPNTKSAVDLNSRLTAELAFIAVMNLKLQTLISQQKAEESAAELAEEGQRAKFNTLAH